MVKVKICGITRLDDAVASLEAGADFLGFILYPPSPRAVSEEFVARFSARLREIMNPLFARPDPPLLVGVFVNRTPEDVAIVLSQCNLDLAQLSGDEEPWDVTSNDSPLFGKAYKAIRPHSQEESFILRDRYTKSVERDPFRKPGLLIDTPHGKLYGGTGTTGDWSLAAALAATTPGLMLAGGLNAENVAQAVATVRPFAVDVAGGVEAQPGIKDHTQVNAFIRHAKSVKVPADG